MVILMDVFGAICLVCFLCAAIIERFEYGKLSKREYETRDIFDGEKAGGK
jgi:ferredoxin